LATDVAFGAPRIQFYEEGEADQTHSIDLNSLEEQKKDRLGDQRGGGEWELIKILLEGD
jgi:hypothetical protein